MYLAAVSGRLMRQNSRSLTHREITNQVVTVDRSFTDLVTASRVMMLPKIMYFTEGCKVVPIA